MLLPFQTESIAHAQAIARLLEQARRRDVQAPGPSSSGLECVGDQCPSCRAWLGPASRKAGRCPLGHRLVRHGAGWRLDPDAPVDRIPPRPSVAPPVRRA